MSILTTILAAGEVPREERAPEGGARPFPPRCNIASGALPCPPSPPPTKHLIKRARERSSESGRGPAQKQERGTRAPSPPTQIQNFQRQSPLSIGPDAFRSASRVNLFTVTLYIILYDISEFCTFLHPASYPHSDCHRPHVL